MGRILEELKWIETPYGFSEATVYDNYTISKDLPKKGDILVNINGDDVFCDTVEEAIQVVKDAIFDELTYSFDKLNEKYDRIYDFKIQIYNDDFYIVDENEYFYYDKPYFDDSFEEVRKVVKDILGKNYDIECECPGRWVIFK